MLFQRHQIDTTLPPTAVAARMTAIIGKRAGWLERQTDEFYRDRKPARLEGESGAEGFDVECVTSRKQSGRPKVTGRYHAHRGGTRVEVTIAMGVGTVVFNAVWVIILGAVLIAHLVGGKEMPQSTMWGVIFMLFFGPAVAIGGFYQDATQAVQLIRDALAR